MHQLPQLNSTSIVIGFDVHKYTHTGVALDVMGQELGTITFTNNSLDECLDWMRELGSFDNLLIGIEDIHSYGHHLAFKLS